MPYEEGDTEVRLRITAAPEDGKANLAIIELLATSLGVSKRSIALVSGEKARHKRFRIACESPEALLELLARQIQSAPSACFQRDA